MAMVKIYFLRTYSKQECLSTIVKYADKLVIADELLLFQHRPPFEDQSINESCMVS